MKKLKYLTMALLAVLVTSCGGSKSDGNSVTLKVEPELGELSNYLSVTDTEVTVTLSEEEHKGEKGKVIAASLAINVTKAVASDYSFSFDVEVLDKNHIKIADLPSFRLDGKTDFDNGDLHDVLVAGNTRAQMKDGVKESKWTDEDQEMWDKICNEGAYICIKPNYDDAKYAEYKGSATVGSDESNDESSTDVAEIDGDNNWDELLDSYEELVDQYIKLMKKAQEGDMSAATEYMEYLQKAQNMNEKFSGAEGNMTPEQWARYTKILTKMTNAAQ